jgi:hypothetical protein
LSVHWGLLEYVPVMIRLAIRANVPTVRAMISQIPGRPTACRMPPARRNLPMRATALLSEPIPRSKRVVALVALPRNERGRRAA